MTKREREKKDWSKYDGESTNIGHILCVDMHYGRELHLSHSSLPLAPEKVDIDENKLSPFARKLLENIKGHNKSHKSKKLVGTFEPRVKYILHSRNLALYLKLGMKLTKIHDVLEFKTSSFLKDYITFCTNKR